MESSSQNPLFPDLPLSLLEAAERKARNWGGRRPGSGAKQKRWRQSAPHRPRAAADSWAPYHATLSRLFGLPNLRRKETFALALRIFREKALLPGFRLTAWTIQSNHLHLLVEAASKEHLSRALQGIQVCLARGWNRIWRRRGAVFAGRFHSRPVKDPFDARRTLAYVLKNHLRHGLSWSILFDPASSALWSDLWLEREFWEKERERHGISGTQPPVASPKTHLLRQVFRPGILSAFGRPQGRFRDLDLPARKALDPDPVQAGLFG